MIEVKVFKGHSEEEIADSFRNRNRVFNCEHRLLSSLDSLAYSFLRNQGFIKAHYVSAVVPRTFTNRLNDEEGARFFCNI